MSPKSSIQVQSKPTENHSTGILMKVMEIPRAKITLKESKVYRDRIIINILAKITLLPTNIWEDIKKIVEPRKKKKKVKQI